jgi:hypothetical protein
MEKYFIAIFFAAMAAGLGWYVRRSIMVGAIGLAIRDDEQFRFTQDDDPFTFWIAVSFAIFLTLLAGVIAVMLILRILLAD